MCNFKEIFFKFLDDFFKVLLGFCQNVQKSSHSVETLHIRAKSPVLLGPGPLTLLNILLCDVFTSLLYGALIWSWAATSSKPKKLFNN